MGLFDGLRQVLGIQAESDATKNAEAVWYAIRGTGASFGLRAGVPLGGRTTLRGARALRGPL